MEWARLNLFQKLVRQWEALHPYNGAQVLQLSAPLPDPVVLEHAWYDTLTSLGLGTTSLQNGRFRFSPISPGDRHRILPGDSLESLLTSELNRIYTEDDSPLRPFFIPIPAGDASRSFHLGIAYRHWVADSIAIRRVLREWYARLFAPEFATSAPLETSAGGYWRLFGPGDFGNGLNWALPPALLAGAASTGRMKRVQRVEHRTSDYTAALALTSLPLGAPGRLHAWARRRGFKVNDVLLAALAISIAREGLLTRTPRRQDMALGSIVDLRQFSRQDLSDTFSLYLGFTTIFLRPRHYRDFPSAVARIAAAHATARSSLAAPASLLRMAAGLVSHRYLNTRDEAAEFYRKRVPLSGGISNVLLREPWLDSPRVENYIRASPTGPMMPVVLAATTLGDHLELTLTHRLALVDPAMARRILTGVCEELASL